MKKIPGAVKVGDILTLEGEQRVRITEIDYEAKIVQVEPEHDFTLDSRFVLSDADVALLESGSITGNLLP